MNATPDQMMRPAWERDRLIVPVPWNRAEAIQTYLREHEVESTLCLEPMTREAHLELHTKMGVDTVQSLLDRWEG